MEKQPDSSRDTQNREPHLRSVRLTSDFSLPKLSALEIGSYAFAILAMWLVIELKLLGGLLAAGEVLMAKMRLFRVPELLAGSFLLGVLAVSASFFLT